MLSGVPSNRRVTSFRGLNMDFSKPATTCDEQISLLRDRGMRIDDPSAARHYLQHINYYRLRAYWLPFEVDRQSHLLRAGTTFKDALALYIFDRELRLLLLDAIERIEVSVRTQWAYYMAHQYGPHSYLDAGFARRGDWHARNLAILLDEVARSDEVFIEHYRNTYTQPESPPIWAVCEVMSLGVLSRWLTNLRPSDRTRIAAVYGLDERVFQAFVRQLTYLRNLCAHHGRVWNRRLTITLKVPRNKPAWLHSSFAPAGDRRIYNSIVMMLYYLDLISPGHHWRSRFFDLVEKHDVDLEQMGFPAEFRNHRIWQPNG